MIQSVCTTGLVQHMSSARATRLPVTNVRFPTTRIPLLLYYYVLFANVIYYFQMYENVDMDNFRLVIVYELVLII